MLAGSPPRTWGIQRQVVLVELRPRFTPTHVGNTYTRRSRESILTVHPHARGEYGREVPQRLIDDGSPPRTWGIRGAAQPVGGDWRFTPTHVGNTFPPSPPPPPPKVHPHARGEYVRSRFFDIPHLRFTPTHVGNTTTMCPSCRTPPVHPHARGEYAGFRLLAVVVHGSPPRTWGIHLEIIGRHSDRRFTPTHVGNTDRIRSSAPLCAVHPHARGEYKELKCPHPKANGSPPRTWGIRCTVGAQAMHLRFTPTHVGNTGSAALVSGWVSVHPHARGEYLVQLRPKCTLLGSPPRTWGIRLRLFLCRFGLRFTPTHVGNTDRIRSSAPPCPVHPHARGEYDRPSREPTLAGGSPPRTWGIPREPSRSSPRPRFTPTHVGNTTRS